MILSKLNLKLNFRDHCRLNDHQEFIQESKPINTYGWINVNDKLPDKDDLNEYLVTDGRHYFIARYRHDVNEWDERRTGRIGDYINDEWVRTPITHWHALPEIPKEE